MDEPDLPATAVRQAGVLFGNHVDTISKVYTKGIERGLKHKYAFSFQFCSTRDEILECSQEEKWDVFILVLNNIITSHRLLEPEKRKETVLDLIRSLKAMSHTTVIALWGWNF